eukprot:5421103-Amphidinium_carterae.1
MTKDKAAATKEPNRARRRTCPTKKACRLCIEDLATESSQRQSRVRCKCVCVYPPAARGCHMAPQ